MKIEYTLFSPQKNYTILVTTPVEKNLRRYISVELLQKEKLAEQLGFVEISGDTCYLDMAGDEFCGNACRCAAFLTKCKKIVCCGIEVESSNLGVKIPKSIKGISHKIIEISNNNEIDREYYEKLIKEESNSVEARGLLFYNSVNDTLIPLVYVPKIDTLFWENSCGSGSVALADYLCKKENMHIKMDINQPGGIISVETDPNWGYVLLDGNIEVVCTGFEELCIQEQSF